MRTLEAIDRHLAAVEGAIASLVELHRTVSGPELHRGPCSCLAIHAELVRLYERGADLWKEGGSVYAAGERA